MIVFAAIDLQQGEVVQLVGGHADSARIRWPDPVAVAQKWVAAGFRALHVVDLDAARGTGSNQQSIETLIGAIDVTVQVGGGVRDEAAVERLLDAGAQRVVVGTRALDDAPWRRQLARQFPGHIVVAADARAGRVVTHAWTRQSTLALTDLLTDINNDPLAAVLVTDVGREGRMTGVDQKLFTAACAISTHPLIAAGGIAGNADIVTLQQLGAAGAVLGMALYTGAVDINLLPGVGS